MTYPYCYKSVKFSISISPNIFRNLQETFQLKAVHFSWMTENQAKKRYINKMIFVKDVYDNCNIYKEG
jgi:hypothetical protein